MVGGAAVSAFLAVGDELGGGLMMINHCSLVASSFTVEALQAQSGTRPRAQTHFHVSDPANAAVFHSLTTPPPFDNASLQ
jgi:hypothetical protein